MWNFVMTMHGKTLQCYGTSSVTICEKLYIWSYLDHSSYTGNLVQFCCRW